MHKNQCMLGQNRYSIQEWKILHLVRGRHYLVLSYISGQFSPILDPSLGKGA